MPYNMAASCVYVSICVCVCVCLCVCLQTLLMLEKPLLRGWSNFGVMYSDV